MKSPISSNNEWKEGRKIGEGVTGVVYSVNKNNIEAILKRPTSNILEAQRQAPQIINEGNILTALQGSPTLTEGLALHTTKLLSRSQSSDGDENSYIVIEKALGFSLTTLVRVARFGTEKLNLQFDESLKIEKLFLRTIETRKCIPDLVVLQALDSLLIFFSRLHEQQFVFDKELKYGIVWNDVKPDHLFWDVVSQTFTIIDWGNSQFLEKGFVTRDRLLSADNDYRQFLDEMGKFLAENNPILKAELNWHSNERDTINKLHSSIKSAIRSREKVLNQLKFDEKTLLELKQVDVKSLKNLQSIQVDILNFGHLPNYFGAVELCKNGFAELIEPWDVGAMEKLALWPIRQEYPNVEENSWILLAHLAGIAKSNDLQFRSAMRSALQEDWRDVFWQLWKLIVSSDHDPDWWSDVSKRLRPIIFKDLDPNAETPLQSLYGLLKIIQDKENDFGITEILREIIKRWRNSDPVPPDAGLEYRDVEQLIERIEIRKDKSDVEKTFLLEIRQNLEKTIYQPRAQVQNLLLAWENREFDQAKKILQILLAWDPDRRRVVAAEREINNAQEWIEDIHKKISEGYEKHLPDLMLRGQKLLTCVGRAGWLQLYLDLLQSIKNGNDLEIFSLLEENPKLLVEIPWLQKYNQNILSNFLKRDLKYFYSLLREWKWADAEEVISRDSLTPWRGAYQNLIDALRNAPNGDLTLGKNHYADDDSDSEEAEAVIKSICNWRNAVKMQGCDKAKKILEGYKPLNEWSLLVDIRNTQGELDKNQLLFNFFKQNMWRSILNELEDIPANSQLAESVKKLVLAQNIWLTKGESLLKRNKTINENLQQGLTLYKEWKNGGKAIAKSYSQKVLMSAAEWDKIETQISEIIKFGKKITKEHENWSPSPSRGYKKVNIEEASEYLKQLEGFEILLIGNISLTRQWIDVFNSITESHSNAKVVSKIMTDYSHPLQQWLTGFPEKKPPKRFAFSALVISLFIFGSVMLFLLRPVLVSYVQKHALVLIPGQAINVTKEPVVPTYETESTESNHQPSVTLTLPIAPESVSCVDLKSKEPNLNLTKIEDYMQSLSNEDYYLLSQKCDLDKNSLDDIRLQRAIYVDGDLDSEAKMEIVQDVYRRLNLDSNTSEITMENFISKGQWMRVTFELCNLNKKTNLTTNQVDIIKEYLEWHLNKYLPDGAKYFTAACGINPENYKERLDLNKKYIPVSNIDLGQESFWPSVDWNSSPCFYFNNGAPQILSHSPTKQLDFSYCPLLVALQEFQNRSLVEGIKMQFSGYKLPVGYPVGYGVSLLQNGSGIIMRLEQQPGKNNAVAMYQVIGKTLIELNRSALYADGFVFSQTFLPDDECATRVIIHPVLVENLVIWQMKTQDLNDEKILGLLAGVMDKELNEKPIEFGFVPWLSPESNSQDIRFCFSELILEKSGELR